MEMNIGLESLENWKILKEVRKRRIFGFMLNSSFEINFGKIFGIKT